MFGRGAGEGPSRRPLRRKVMPRGGWGLSQAPQNWFVVQTGTNKRTEFAARDTVFGRGGTLDPGAVRWGVRWRCTYWCPLPLVLGPAAAALFQKLFSNADSPAPASETCETW